MRASRTLVVAVALIASPSVARAQLPWTLITATDLREIHRLLLANHPGPVDRLNPKFKVWLEGGYRQGLVAAASARSYLDYRRILQTYVTGFRDGHSQLRPLIDVWYWEWPGFLPALYPDGSVRVGVSEVRGIDTGDRILSCDGQSPTQMFDKLVAPVFWNRDIPQQRELLMPNLLMRPLGDPKFDFKVCTLEGHSGRRNVELQWRRVRAPAAADLRAKADGRVVPDLGIRKVDGIWLISIPSFDYQSGTDVEKFRAFLNVVKSHTAELRSAPKIVIDVRGNRGGMSRWGFELASYIWGNAIIDSIRESFAEYVDWRASPDNLDHWNKFIADSRKANLDTSVIESLEHQRDVIAAALVKHERLAREGSSAKPSPPVLPPSPAVGKFYFLTDDICTSSCLDFADVILRIPGVTHIGRATDADALYIDIDQRVLPSHLSEFAYSMKVYRERVRGNNIWYEPKIKWPGGPMTDEAVIKWVATLP